MIMTAYWSNIEPLFFMLPLFGLVIGIFGTVLGGGGGFFFMPLLTLLFNTPTHIAIITSLIASLPIGIAGALGHYRQGNIDFTHGLRFIAFGIIGAIAGSITANHLSSLVLNLIFGLYLITMGINMSYNSYKKNKKTHETTIKLKKSNSLLFKSSSYGFISGIISGTFGTSGTAPVLAGLFALNIPYAKVIGTSLLIISANAIFAISTHINMGKIDLTISAFLTAGTLIGGITGPLLFKKSGLHKLKKSPSGWYGLVIGVLGIMMILKH